MREALSALQLLPHGRSVADKKKLENYPQLHKQTSSETTLLKTAKIWHFIIFQLDNQRPS